MPGVFNQENESIPQRQKRSRKRGGRMMQRQTTLIVDMQFGSTGKGLLAGFLAQQDRPDTAVCAFGPNAGHTFIDKNGERFVATMLPMGVFSPNLDRVLIGPGAVINPDKLMEEINTLAQDFDIELRGKVFVHELAAVVNEDHRQLELSFARIGSTMKGTAEAIIQKMRRNPRELNIARFHEYLNNDAVSVVSSQEYNSLMDQAHRIQVEGAQGFSLGLNQRFYPYATSRECTAWQVLSDCLIPRFDNVILTWGTMRTYPIRVANRPEGTSGGHYPDQSEITFKSIDQEQEFTTVTKLPRRLFSFSKMQIIEAMRMNDCDFMFLNFINYVPEDAREEYVQFIQDILHRFGTRILLFGHGPKVTDIRSHWASPTEPCSYSYTDHEE
jgi:adenylosuccinate synthase